MRELPKFFGIRVQIRLTSECVANIDSGRRLYVLLRRQRSTFHRPVVSPRTIGNRAFGVARCGVYENSLTPDVTTPTSLSVFERRLKTLLFNRPLDCNIWLFFGVTLPYIFFSLSRALEVFKNKFYGTLITCTTVFCTYYSNKTTKNMS